MNQISPGQFHGIRQVVVNGKILDDCQANRSCLISWLHEDQGETIQSITPAWFRAVLAENPPLESQLAWVSAKSISREEFNQFARLNGLSEADANWHLARSVLGKKLNETDLVRAFNSGALRFAPAGADEIEQREKQVQENQAGQERATLLGTDQIAVREIAQRHSQHQRESAQRQALEREIVLGFERDCIFGIKEHPLPQTWSGQSLNAQAIKDASAEVLKALFRRFGSAQVTARMHGIKTATATVDRGDGNGPREVTYQFA